VESNNYEREKGRIHPKIQIRNEVIYIINAFIRVLVKEYDHSEIENMPSLDTEKTKIKDEIDSISNDLFRSCSAGYSEIYYALLHLKVVYFAYIYLIVLETI
jgi:hypothetical protein